MTGKLKSLFGAKLYGFITTPSKTYFFHKENFIGHWNDLEYDYQKTEEPIVLEFEEDTPGKKGPRAKNVRRVDWPNRSE